MKAIETKYLGPTNFRGSRIKVTDGDNSMILGMNDALDVDDNHDQAALAFFNDLGWHGKLIRGGTKRGYVYVFAHDHMIKLGKRGEK